MRGETGTMMIFTRSDQPQSLTRDCKARCRCQAVWRSRNQGVYSRNTFSALQWEDGQVLFDLRLPLMTDCADGNDGSSLSGDQSPVSPG